jgi:Asp-tRNA(Asn)/Glu-tRNA(Gln) amidotransferase A subunit family amidase
MNPFLGVVEASARLRSGEVSAREVIEATLQRIERLDPGLRCYLTVAAAAGMRATGAPR